MILYFTHYPAVERTYYVFNVVDSKWNKKELQLYENDHLIDSMPF